MILLKPPDAPDTWMAVQAFAWTVAFALLGTLLLETVGIVDAKDQLESLIAFDESLYFLPLNEALGIDGRWPGPFGHNGDTAMMAALLVVIAFAKWQRSSFVFLFVGTIAFLITDGRASLGAAVAGLLLLFALTTSGRIGQFPRRYRIVISGAIVLLLTIGMYLRPAGLTGRNVIWPAFIEAWTVSPLVGLGSSGIASGGEIVSGFGHAHSLYIDELARWGLVGFLTQFSAIGFGLVLAIRAAKGGSPAPLALMVTYLVTGVTEPRNNWIVPSPTWLLLVLCVILASLALQRKTAPSERFGRRGITAPPSHSAGPIRE